ncbi:LysR family transcriptional regulator [Aliiglaciecola lipolytica]|uniref:LysR family transcriptional regulator n=1 Tax=Aliiglaciecola lipolytica TaxID=477689 RepID=UPI00058C636A|nr:LysR family transcriptional regulator [Aliiglaciecola lipolytica]
MDIRFLSTFLEVANTRHFGKAADNLYLTQSAVSARIKLLEEYFNTALFIRNRNSIQLTPAGEQLIPYAKQLSAKLLEAKQALNHKSTRFLSVATTPNAFYLSLDNALCNVAQQFPHVSLRTDLGNTELLSRQLHERTIDMAFTTEPLKLDNVETSQILEIPLSFFAKSTSDELEDYIHIEWSHKVTDNIYQQFPQLRNARLKTSSYQIGLQQLSCSQKGCALLPDSGQYAGLNKLDIQSDFNVRIYLNVIENNGIEELVEVVNFVKNSLASTSIE